MGLAGVIKASERAHPEVGRLFRDSDSYPASWHQPGKAPGEALAMVLVDLMLRLPRVSDPEAPDPSCMTLSRMGELLFASVIMPFLRRREVQRIVVLADNQDRVVQWTAKGTTQALRVKSAGDSDVKPYGDQAYITPDGRFFSDLEQQEPEAVHVMRFFFTRRLRNQAFYIFLRVFHDQARLMGSTPGELDLVFDFCDGQRHFIRRSAITGKTTIASEPEPHELAEADNAQLLWHRRLWEEHPDWMAVIDTVDSDLMAQWVCYWSWMKRLWGDRPPHTIWYHLRGIWSHPKHSRGNEELQSTWTPIAHLDLNAYTQTVLGRFWCASTWATCCLLCGTDFHFAKMTFDSIPTASLRPWVWHVAQLHRAQLQRCFEEGEGAKAVRLLVFGVRDAYEVAASVMRTSKGALKAVARRRLRDPTQTEPDRENLEPLERTQLEEDRESPDVERGIRMALVNLLYWICGEVAVAPYGETSLKRDLPAEAWVSRKKQRR